MSTIHGVPVPSAEQIIIGIELAFFLYPFKRAADYMWRKLFGWMNQPVRHNRNRIIEQHVKSGHQDRFKYCREGECATIQTQPEPALISALPELLELSDLSE